MSIKARTYMKLGIIIRDMRIRKGLSQGELADASDLSQTYLSQIENNQKEPNISTLRRIAKELGIPLPVLFYLSLGVEDIPDEKRKAFELLSPTIKSLVESVFLSNN